MGEATKANVVGVCGHDEQDKQDRLKADRIGRHTHQANLKLQYIRR